MPFVSEARFQFEASFLSWFFVRREARTEKSLLVENTPRFDAGNTIEKPRAWDLSQPSSTLLVEGSLEVNLPTIWTDEKQSREEAKRRERLEERRVIRRERVRRKKMQMREKVEKSRNSVFFQWFGAPEGRKVAR